MYTNRRVRRVTASKAALAAACPGSHVLPWEYGQAEHPTATRGKNIASALEAYRTGTDALSSSLKAGPDYEAAIEAIRLSPKLSTLPELAGSAEVAFGLATRNGTGTVFGYNIGRNYPRDLGPDWWTGTADQVGLDGEGRVAVYDDKSGKRKNLTLPAESWQLRVLAVMVEAATGRQVERVGWYLTNSQELEVQTLQSVQNDDTRAAIALTQSRIAEASTAETTEDLEPYLRRNNGCKYCAARPNCPLWQ